MRLSSTSFAAIGVFALTVAAADSSELKDTRQRFSYSLGMSLGTNLKRSGMGVEQVDADTIFRALKDSMSGSPCS